jgi:cell division protein FtsB
MRVGLVLAAGLVLALLLTGRVLLLNQITVMRAEIAQLNDRKGFLETRAASLQQRYNQQTSAAVVIGRAERELKLVQPAEPGLVLVRLPRDSGKSRWALPAWLGNLAGGDPAQATPPAAGLTTGAMVHLNPENRSPQAVREAQ